MNGKPILLVEDHPDDEFLTLHTLKKNRIENVVVTREAKEALNYLVMAVNYGGHHESFMPGLILLDLRLPKMDGFEFLEAVRADERTRDIPVVILSSSQQQKDVDRCRNLGVKAYINKPLDSNKLAKAMHALNR
ncbi:MAG: response regulator [Geobacteraceae bacterium]|nr:MAG: response regulator [Geobacteraceae bacterium]